MRENRGFTLVELLVVISIIALLIGILLPAIGKARDSTLIVKSLSNLKNFGTAHATYASEWDGRQWTTTPDDLTVLLDGGGYQQNYDPNTYPNIPPVPLGFDRNGVHHKSSFGSVVQPMWYTSNCSIGSFRLFHMKPFNQYVNGKVYDPIFWAPKDDTVNERIEQWMEDPGEWPVDWVNFPNGRDLTLILSSYCTSVAAMVSPEVFAGGRNGRRATDLAGGHRSPNLGQASYPDLKTHMVEHRWLQNPPSPNIPGNVGVPWFYNMGPDSTPAVLFYDGHIRMMSTREAVRSSRRVEDQGADPLDAFDRACFGSGGYFEGFAYNGARDEISSWHIFTRDGIKGRDTTGG